MTRFVPFERRSAIYKYVPDALRPVAGLNLAARSSKAGAVNVPVCTGGTGHSSGTQPFRSGPLQGTPAGPAFSARTLRGPPTASGWRCRTGRAGSRKQRMAATNPARMETTRFKYEPIRLGRKVCPYEWEEILAERIESDFRLDTLSSM